MQLTLKKSSYRQTVVIIFTVSVVASIVGSAVMAADYVTVYQTVCNFSPYITRITRSGTGEDQRNITIYMNLANSGSRPIYIYQYGIHLELNGNFVADQQEFFPDLWLQPGDNITITITLVVVSSFVHPILEAEESGQWEWLILFSMRIWIVWLYLIPHFYIMWWDCEEVA